MEPPDKDIRKVGGCQRSAEHERNLRSLTRWERKIRNGSERRSWQYTSCWERAPGTAPPFLFPSMDVVNTLVPVFMLCSGVRLALKIAEISNVAGKAVGYKHRYDEG